MLRIHSINVLGGEETTISGVNPSDWSVDHDEWINPNFEQKTLIKWIIDTTVELKTLIGIVTYQTNQIYMNRNNKFQNCKFKNMNRLLRIFRMGEGDD